MKKILKYLMALVLLVALTAVGGSCSSTPTTTVDSGEEAAVRAYADPATKTTLEGLSEGSLAKYTQYASDQFKSALTQEVFDETSAKLKSQLGAFISVTFVSIEHQDSYTVVHYKAKYEKSGVGVRMIFDKDELIAGQWFE